MNLVASSALLICFLISAAPAVGAHMDNLHLVKRIYLGSIIGDRNEELPINNILKREFEKNGFIIVDEAAKSDAILTGSIMSELPLDDKGSDQPRYFHEVKLTSPGGVELWKATIKFYSDLTDSERMEKGARRIVERIFNDWKKSAKKAGIKP